MANKIEYAIYPFDYMRITQRHDEGNHLAHWYPFKGCSDKPWDEACLDGGRSYFVPKNDYLVVEKIKNKNGCNNIVLMSCDMLKIPYQKAPTYIYVSLTHMNNDDYNRILVGQILHKGERIIREGSSGASANHFHVTAGLPEYYGQKENGNEKYCFVCDKALEPNQAFYVDDTVDILDNKLYDFTPVPNQDFFPEKGYFTLGDTDENIGKISDFMIKNFYGYGYKTGCSADLVKGNYYGKNLRSWIIRFQLNNDLEADGNFGSPDLEKLKEYGFEE